MSIDKKDSGVLIIRNKWITKIKTIFEANEMCCIVLTDWEMEFLDSIDKQLSESKPLTWKQSKCLNSIYERIK